MQTSFLCLKSRNKVTLALTSPQAEMKRALRVTKADQTIWTWTTRSDAPCHPLGSPGRGRTPTTLPSHFRGLVEPRLRWQLEGRLRGWLGPPAWQLAVGQMQAG